MPAAYTKYQLQKTYEQIALERPRVCDECKTFNQLSHSHLIHKSYYGQYLGVPLQIVKENIVYHCLSMGRNKGCHDLWDSMDAPKMDTFEKNMRIIYKLDRTFFWKKMHSMHDHWLSRSSTPEGLYSFRKIRTLISEIDKLEHEIHTDQKQRLA